MMKVGIVSHYYRSLNYGGNLQAYALCRVLQQYGVESEQICLRDKNRKLPWEQGRKDLTLYQLFSKVLRRVNRIAQKTATQLFLKDLAQKRQDAFAYFNQSRIPHSQEVYDGMSIESCVDRYDVLVTGSDQVWNLRWYHPAYFLAFAKEKPKFSYGASMACSELTEQEQMLVRNNVKDYVGVSVRESQSAKMLEQVLHREVRWVLDPTMLLSSEDWDEVCSPRIVQAPYVFCYFLASAPGARKLAEKYARQQGLKLVSIPHLYGKLVLEDVCFGDIRIDAPSPEQLISLIKHAQCVFTDSFHAMVFSSIYRREYFVFPRHKSGGMDDRIYSLAGLLGSMERFCDTPEKKQLAYLLSCGPMDYTQTVKMTEMKRSSRQYIEDCLELVRKQRERHEA